MRPSSPTRRRQSTAMRRPVALASVVAAALLLTACGTRVNEAAIIKYEGADGTAVTPLIGSNQGTTTGGTTGATTGSPSTTGGTSTGGSTGGSSGTSGTTGAVTTGGATGGTTGGTTGTTGAGGSTTGATSGGTSAGTTGSSAAGCTKQGPPVIVGQVGTFSGLVGANFQGAVKTPYVWTSYMNAHGGLGCHPIRFVQIDDQSNPSQSQAAVERLESMGAVAIFGAFTPLDIAGFIAGVNKAQIAVIGGDQSEPEWLTNKYLYPVGGTSRAAIAGSVKQAAGIGRKKIAVLYCVEASPCGSNFYDTIIKDGYAKKFGMTPVYSGSISITQPDFTSQCQNAKNAGADTIAWGLDRAGLQRAAKSCASIGYYPTLPLIALQGAFDPSDANIRKSGAFLSSPTFPYLLNSTPAQKTFHDAMRQYAPTAPIDTSASIVWSDGMMLAKVIENLGTAAQGRALTKADLFVGATKVKGETLDGLVPPTTWKSVGPQLENPCYFGIAFSPNGFRAPGGSTPACI